MSDETTGDLKSLLPWPKEEGEVSVDLMLRHAGADAQLIWLQNGDALATEPRKRTREQARAHHWRVSAIIAAVGFMAALRALREVDPDRALEVARDHWLMCDAGDSFGEFLWEWLAEAGVDPGLITLPNDA